MTIIPLSNGMHAVVDDEDAEAIGRHRWTAQRAKNGRWYAMRLDRSGGRQKKIYMHRQVAGACPGERVDHQDGDGLNNRKGNLRDCTNAQNMMNMRRAGTKPKGVSWFRRDQRWRAYIVLGGKQKHLGYFDVQAEAAAAYDRAALEMFGEFAAINGQLPDLAAAA